MSKKMVIKADLVGKACMSDILAVVAKHQGKSMDIDADKCTLTVVGTADPVRIAQRLKKKCFAVTIVSVADDKPKSPEPKKDTCKEVCEKLCKERCEKLPCGKECKDKCCEKACKERCESRCKAWLEGCSCSRCSPSTGFCYTPSCKERCHKLPCGKECKDKCEKACKQRCESCCKARLEGCSCSRCSPSTGFCYTPGYPAVGVGAAATAGLGPLVARKRKVAGRRRSEIKRHHPGQ